MWLNDKELAAYIKIKEKTIYYLVSKCVIPHYRIGRLLLFNQKEIDSWMESKREKSLQANIDKIKRSIYTHVKGRPDHLKKEVKNAL